MFDNTSETKLHKIVLVHPLVAMSKHIWIRDRENTKTGGT